MELVILLLLIWLILEAFLHIWLGLLRRRFTNVIITGKDEAPILSRTGLEKFFKHGYDPELGWVRKPNTSKVEKSLEGDKTFHVNDIGSRTNPGHEDLPMKVVSYGDSYTFGREINDNETFQHFLAKKLKCNIGNFGVGNYGLDQAFLRFKRECDKWKKAKTLLIGVVPDTVQRNLAMWKHFSEYGNTFGFKPRFIIEDNKLKLLENPGNKKENFYDVKPLLKTLKANDHFYKAKFRRDVFKFPYFWSILRYPKRKITLFTIYSGVYALELLHIDWRKSKILPSQKATRAVQYNVKDLIKYYKDPKLLNVTIEIAKEFAELAKKHNMKPLLLLLPMHNDLEYMKETEDIYYKPLLEKLSPIMPCVDMGEHFLKHDINDFFYTEGEPGAYTKQGDHYNAKGNKLVADVTHKFMKKHGFELE
ncbi:MAG: hypothetical protein ACE5FT_01830 [Candidatus Nanoarchaeia archaeon]